MKNRVFALTMTVVALTACSGGDSGGIACKEDYWNGVFGTCLPSDWVVIDAETLRQRGVPQDTIVAFQSTIPLSGQFPTVAVTREVLASVVSAQAYSEASVRAVTVLPGYEELDTRDLRVAEEKVNCMCSKHSPPQMNRFAGSTR